MTRALGLLLVLQVPLSPLNPRIVLTPASGCTITTASVSQSAVTAAISAAAEGDVVCLPAGTATWTSGVSISGKGITVRGAGSGRIVARSTSAIAVGTGTKTFTVQASGLGFTNGQTLRIFWLGDSSGWPGTNNNGRATFMQGTVSSYSGTTLTMSMSLSGGSGTHADWLIGTTSATTITNNSGSTLFSITEDATHPVEVSGFKVAAGSGTASIFVLSGVTSGKPTKLHDMWLEDNASSGTLVEAFVTRGLIWNVSFDASPFESAELAVIIRSTDHTNWQSASTMGTADTTGTRNFYIEDSDFHNFINATDFDNNARVVVRHSLLHHAAIGTHGNDTSSPGMRHLEAYHNTWVAGSESGGYPLNWWILLRGGTMVVTDNVIPDLRPSDGKSELTLWIVVLGEAESGCWGASTPGIQYPAPRQVGFGYVTGTGVDGLGRSTDDGVYVGDREPIYSWNNTGTTAIGVDDTGDGGCGGSPDPGSAYVQSGREYFLNAGAKPGYTPYAYPHPARAS